MDAIKDIFSSISGDVVPALIGAIFGLILSVVFDEGLRNIKRQIIRRFKRLFKTKTNYTSDLFSIGNMQTSFFVVDGDGRFEFKPEDIETRLETNPPILPDELQELKKEIELQEKAKKEQGLNYRWNGPLYGLKNYRNNRFGDMEEMEALFHFYKTDYFTFLATNMQLDRQLDSGESIREKYIPDELEKIQPLLANGFGVVLVVITDDEDVILTKRTQVSGARGNELDVSVVEGVHPTLDLDHASDGPNLFNVAVRGANEELGINIDENLVRFLGYGIDLDYYQWNMIGFAHLPQSSKEIKSIRSRGTSGKWENTLLIYEKFTPKNIARLIIEKDMWSTARVALYWTAVRELGKMNIDRAIKKHQR